MSIDALRNQSYTDFQALNDLKRQARANDPAAVRETARQFETLFARMMLKSMREASMGDELFDSQESQMYRGMFDDQMALELTKGRGLGIADMMVQQLMRGQIAQQAAAGDVGRTSLTAAPQAANPLPLPERAQPATLPARPSVTPVAPPATSAPVAQAAVAESPARPAAGTRAAFLEAMLPAATQAARALGVAPRAILAQAALETGWGRSMPFDAEGRPSLNLFGIKATPSWRGASVASETTEFVGGQATRQVERFRAYDSIEASFADHARLLSNSARYAGALNTGDDVHRYATALQQGGYATDPHYARKLVAVADTVDQLLAGRVPGRAGS